MDNEQIEPNRIDRNKFHFRSALTVFGVAFGASQLIGKSPEGKKETDAKSTPAPPSSAPKVPTKDSRLVVLNSKPWNAETPPHLLDDKYTPADKLFVPNNGVVSDNLDPETWTLTIEGESSKEIKNYTLEELKSKFEHHTYQLT